MRKNQNGQHKNQYSSKVNSIHHEESDSDSLFALNENRFNQSILDSGATSHASNQKSIFSSLDQNYQTSIKEAKSFECKFVAKVTL